MDSPTTEQASPQVTTTPVPSQDTTPNATPVDSTPGTASNISGFDQSATYPGQSPAVPQTPAMDTGQTTDASASSPTSFEPSGGSKVPKVIGLVVLAIVVIAGLGLGGYYLGKSRVFVPTPSLTPEPTLTETPTPEPTATATPDPTADWTKYEDAKNGYSFKYSSDFKIADYSESGYKGKSVTYLGPTQPKSQTSISDGIKLTTLVIPNVKKDFKTYVTEAAKLEAVGGATSSTAKELVVDGKSAYQYTVDGKTDNTKVVFVNLNGTFIRIAGLYASDETKYLAIVDQIISTFKFVTASPSPTATPVQ